MIKIIISLLITISLIKSNIINQDILEIHTELFSKIIQYDKKFNRVKHYEIIIISKDINEYLLKKIQKFLMLKCSQCHINYIYDKNINEKNFQNVNAVFIFELQEEYVKKISKFSYDENFLTYSYHFNDLQNGMMLSAKLTNRVEILINLKNILKGKIFLDPFFILNTTKINEKKEK